MGLDLALGGIILVAALRGWLKGFVGQAVRIGGFIACFYLADPVREQVRPYVIGKMPAIDAGLLDRILWWVAAMISYVVLVGLANLAIQLTRTRSPAKVPGTGHARRSVRRDACRYREGPARCHVPCRRGREVWRRYRPEYSLGGTSDDRVVRFEVDGRVSARTPDLGRPARPQLRPAHPAQRSQGLGRR